MSNKTEIEVYYKTHPIKKPRITYCPNCLRVGYPNDFLNFETDEDNKSATAICRICNQKVKLMLGREVIRIKLKKIRTFFLLFCDDKDAVNFMLKPYTGGFKQWHFYNECREYLGYKNADSVRDLFHLGRYQIKEIASYVETVYNKAKLPLIYFDELGDYELKFKEEQ